MNTIIVHKNIFQFHLFSQVVKNVKNRDRYLARIRKKKAPF